MNRMSKAKPKSVRSFNRLRHRLKKEDLEHVLAKRDQILDKVSEQSRLRQFTSEVKLFLAMIQDYLNGSYTQIPLKSILAIAAALIYVLNPFDVIPDFIFGLGFVDDLTVFGYCLKLIGKDVEAYKEWKDPGAGK